MLFPMKLHVEVSTESAIRAKSPLCGVTDVALTEGVLSRVPDAVVLAALKAFPPPPPNMSHVRFAALEVEGVDDESLVEALLRWGEEEAAKTRAKEAEREARIVAALAAPDEEWLTTVEAGYPPVTVPGVRSRSLLGLSFEESQDPRVTERVAALEASIAPRREAIFAAAKAERDAAREAREARKVQEAEGAALWEALAKTAWDALVEKHGNASQRARWKEGVMPGEEHDALDARIVFQFLDEQLKPYPRLTPDDVHDVEECSRTVEFEKVDEECWTEAAWAVRQHILDIEPDAHLTARTHSGTCDRCKAHVEREGVLVRLRGVDGAVHAKEYAVPRDTK